MVTPERQYTIAAAADARPLQSYELFTEQAAEAPLSAYHAAFGSAPPPQPLEPAPAQQQGTQRAVDKRVQQLFDVPSHLIPPLDQLLGRFVLAVAGQQRPQPA